MNKEKLLDFWTLAVKDKSLTDYFEEIQHHDSCKLTAFAVSCDLIVMLVHLVVNIYLENLH